MYFFSCDVIAAMMDDISKRCPTNVASSVGTSNMEANAFIIWISRDWRKTVHILKIIISNQFYTP